MGQEFTAPCHIESKHDASTFDCGKDELNDWLKKTAHKNEGETSRTYVVCLGDRIVGYYCLAAGSVLRKELPTAKLRRNAPGDIPVIVLGRLAVEKEFARIGIGSGMLKDAFYRSLKASHEFGIKAIVVHALDDEAVTYYLANSFLPSGIHPRTLVLPIETLKRAAVEACESDRNDSASEPPLS